jgi:4-hydroxy-tetrahydrodipicolinate synthase
MFEGVMVAIVTPFRNGQVDEAAFRRLINRLIDNGISGIVPCGTTGESATMLHDEHKRVTEVCIDEVNKRVPVLAGTGSNNTAEAVDLTRHAHQAGADGALMVSPYYNKPTQAGLYQHFKTAADAAPIPIMLYNIPGRTGVNIAPETMGKLAEIDNIVGVKEASGDIGQMARVIEACGPDFDVVSGDDGMTLPLLSIGGKGVISVAGQVMPREMADMYQAWKNNDPQAAREKFMALLPLFRAMFFETNPIPVKTALSMMGLIEPDLRLPMYAMAEENKEKLRRVLSDYGLV